MQKMNKNEIQIGAHQLSWSTTIEQTDIHPIAEKISSLGCGAFELFLNGFGDDFPAATLRTAASDNKLSIIGCAVFGSGDKADPLSKSAAQRQKAENMMIQWIDILHALNSKLLVGPLFNVLRKKGAKEPTEHNFKAGITTFTSIAKHAAQKKIKIAIEPLQWVEMPWPNNVQQILDFIERFEKGLDAPFKTLGVTFDVYHALRMEENWRTALKHVLEAGRLYHVHVAGPNRTPPRRNQHISWKSLISTLKEFGWKGFITIESFGDQCDLPFEVIGPGNRPPAEEVISTGVKTLRWAGIEK